MPNTLVHDSLPSDSPARQKASFVTARVRTQRPSSTSGAGVSNAADGPAMRCSDSQRRTGSVLSQISQISQRDTEPGLDSRPALHALPVPRLVPSFDDVRFRILKTHVGATRHLPNVLTVSLVILLLSSRFGRASAIAVVLRACVQNDATKTVPWSPVSGPRIFTSRAAGCLVGCRPS